MEYICEKLYLTMTNLFVYLLFALSWKNFMILYFVDVWMVAVTKRDEI